MTAVTESGPKSLSPRIRHTRLLLQEALVRLLGKKKNFDEISVQNVTEEARVMRSCNLAVNKSQTE
jgi:hypothetical protein